MKVRTVGLYSELVAHVGVAEIESCSGRTGIPRYIHRQGGTTTIPRPSSLSTSFLQLGLLSLLPAKIYFTRSTRSYFRDASKLPRATNSFKFHMDTPFTDQTKPTPAPTPPSSQSDPGDRPNSFDTYDSQSFLSDDGYRGTSLTSMAESMAPPPPPPPPRTKCSHDRHIVFDEVEIRSYKRIMSDNPSVSAGPPVGLSWEWEDENTEVSA